MLFPMISVNKGRVISCGEFCVGIIYGNVEQVLRIIAGRKANKRIN